MLIYWKELVIVQDLPPKRSKTCIQRTEILATGQTSSQTKTDYMRHILKLPRLTVWQKSLYY